MELKPQNSIPKSTCLRRLNRTFYGIETTSSNAGVIRPFVLIVPFMELKLVSSRCLSYAIFES